LARFERILRPQITMPSRTTAIRPAISLFLVFSVFALSVWAGSRTGPGGWVCTGTSPAGACATLTVTAADSNYFAYFGDRTDPFAGIRGELVRSQGQEHLVINVHVLSSSVSVVVDSEMVASL